MELYLRNENLIVYKFYSASEALACINRERLDLAILDVMLPGISGLQIQHQTGKHNNIIIHGLLRLSGVVAFVAAAGKDGRFL